MSVETNPNLLDRLEGFRDYEHVPRLALPGGLRTFCFGEDSAILFALKRYNMVRKGGKKFGQAVRDAVDNLINDEFRNGDIGFGSGFGFSILSEDILNVCVWGQEIPYVLRNKLYQYQEGTALKKLERLSTDEVGPFCGWELGIVAHETFAWMKYLGSGRSKKDKRTYLDNFAPEALWS
jgi:hypothetical protein